MPVAMAHMQPSTNWLPRMQTPSRSQIIDYVTALVFFEADAGALLVLLRLVFFDPILCPIIVNFEFEVNAPPTQ
jgi:hypothetical protein